MLNTIPPALRDLLAFVPKGEFTSFSGSFGPDIADHTQIIVGANNGGENRWGAVWPDDRRNV